MATDFLQIPMTALGVVLMDISGRRPLLMVTILRIVPNLWCCLEKKPIMKCRILQISAAGTCLGCFFVAMSFLSQVLKIRIHFSWFTHSFLVFVRITKVCHLQSLHKWIEFSPFLALMGVLVSNARLTLNSVVHFFLISIHRKSRSYGTISFLKTVMKKKQKREAETH